MEYELFTPKLRRKFPDVLVYTDDMLTDALDTAKWFIIRERYKTIGVPEGTMDIEVQYDQLCCDMASEILARWGAEGQATHAENGVSRTWAFGVLAGQFHGQIIPKVGVL